jgi:hypothetical protein
MPYLSYPFETQWREALSTVMGYRGLVKKLHQSLKVHPSLQFHKQKVDIHLLHISFVL